MYTQETISERALERRLQTGDRLWVAGDKVSSNAFRQGNSPNNPAIYLRWADFGILKEGKIEGDDSHKVVINPGQGLSMFIEKMVKADFTLISSQQGNFGKAELRRLMEEKACTEARLIHWFKMTEGRVMPTGLEVIFDNHPPGHCTLTVTRNMTVHEFLHLVNEHLGFDYVGTYLFGKH